MLLREGERQWRGGATGDVSQWPGRVTRSADSCEPLLISYSCTHSSPVGCLGLTTGPLSRSPRQAERVQPSHGLAVVLTRQRAAAKKKVSCMDWMVFSSVALIGEGKKTVCFSQEHFYMGPLQLMWCIPRLRRKVCQRMRWGKRGSPASLRVLLH